MIVVVSKVLLMFWCSQQLFPIHALHSCTTPQKQLTFIHLVSKAQEMFSTPALSLLCISIFVPKYFILVQRNVTFDTHSCASLQKNNKHPLVLAKGCRHQLF